MIDATEARKGVTIELDGQLYNILDYQHIKVGRGSAHVKLRLRDIRAGHTIERRKEAQYLYQDSDLYYFMDNETFEQTPLTSKQLGDALNYIKEGMTLMISQYGDEALGIELPITVELLIAETGPGYKGDTSQAGTKPAILETGITIQVPFFVNTGDMVRVDTRDGSYVERA
jgi:elongation factor P